MDQTILALQNVQKQVAHSSHEHYSRIGELVDFLRHFRNDLPNQTPKQAFERVQPLRRWLFWLPPAMLRGGETGTSALAILAQFFGIGVALDGIFPDLGGAYLGPLSVGPIEEIYRIIVARSTTDPFNPDLQMALNLMDLPQQIVAQYKNRLYLSPRSSIDYSSPAPPSPYNKVHSSSPSTSSSYTAYTPPLHSPPEVAVANSLDLVDYMTAPTTTSQSFYPPSPGLHSEPRGSVSSNFSSTYPEDILCGNLPRADDTLGMIMGYYEPPPGANRNMEVPESCWT